MSSVGSLIKGIFGVDTEETLRIKQRFFLERDRAERNAEKTGKELEKPKLRVGNPVIPDGYSMEEWQNGKFSETEKDYKLINFNRNFTY